MSQETNALAGRQAGTMEPTEDTLHAVKAAMTAAVVDLPVSTSSVESCGLTNFKILSGAATHQATALSARPDDVVHGAVFGGRVGCALWSSPSRGNPRQDRHQQEKSIIICRQRRRGPRLLHCRTIPYHRTVLAPIRATPFFEDTLLPYGNMTSSRSMTDKGTKTRRRWFGLGRKKNLPPNLAASSSLQSDAYSRASAPAKYSSTARGGVVVPTETTTNGKKSSTNAAASKTTPSPPSSPPRISRVASSAQQRGWLFRNKRFQKVCDAVFEAVDTDGSGNIDEKELYAGLLLIHLKLGAYAGPAACRPLGRERCSAVFADMDTDDSGHLDRHEFRLVMIYLFGNVLIRVLVQWSMTLLIVPLVAQSILDGIYWTVDALYDFVTTLDEDFWIANQVELFLESLWAFFLISMPSAVLSAGGKIGTYVDMVPDSVWNSIPLTLLSTILGIAVVPYMIFSIDEFFTKAAKAKRTEMVKQD